jgi:hypothetical protein
MYLSILLFDVFLLLSVALLLLHFTFAIETLKKNPQLSETLKNGTEPILLVKHNQNLLIWDCSEETKIIKNL